MYAFGGLNNMNGGVAAAVDVPPPELLADPNIDDPAAWTDSDLGTGVSTVSGGQMVLNGSSFANRAERRSAFFPTVIGGTYTIEADVTLSGASDFLMPFDSSSTLIGVAADYNISGATGTVQRSFTATTATSRLTIRGQSGVNFTITRLSVKRS